MLRRAIARNNEGRRKAGLQVDRYRIDYVVARGFTQMEVAGTTLGAGAVILQPGSDPGVHAGRLGLICCVSFSVLVLM
jgi:hypothetical protein